MAAQMQTQMQLQAMPMPMPVLLQLLMLMLMPMLQPTARSNEASDDDGSSNLMSPQPLNRRSAAQTPSSSNKGPG